MIRNNDYNTLSGRGSNKDSLKIIISAYLEENQIERDITYNHILQDLKDLNYNNYIKELEYRLSNNENLNEVLMSIINRNDETKSTIGYHKNIIEYYLNQDFFKLFE